MKDMREELKITIKRTAVVCKIWCPVQGHLGHTLSSKSLLYLKSQLFIYLFIFLEDVFKMLNTPKTLDTYYFFQPWALNSFSYSWNGL